MRLPVITVRPGREKPLIQKHPWVFSGAIASEDKGIEPGSLVEIRSEKGEFLAKGYANPKSKIRARALSFDEGEKLDAAFFRKRVAQAVQQGGKIIRPPFDVEGVGRIAIVADPTGAMMGWMTPMNG